MSRPETGPPSLDLQQPVKGDRAWMARALERAREAWDRNEVPVGAVLVLGGKILSEGSNQTIQRSDPTAHAEVVAIREGAAALGDWRLVDTTLYVTLEPCAQCSGAIVLARIARVVYGATDPKAGMAGSLGNLLQHPRLNHRTQVTAGVLGDASAALLQDFFRQRRSARLDGSLTHRTAQPTKNHEQNHR